MVKNIAMLCGLVILTLSVVNKCLACDCALLSEQERLKNADAVFVGKVIGVEASGSNTKFIFQVAKSIKGANPVEVTILGGESDCDFSFCPGTVYVVYARRFDGRLIAGACSGTAALSLTDDNVRSPAGTPAPPAASLPHNEYRDVAVITGASVLLSLLIGFLIMNLRRRAA
jgi:hypothetical protein